MDSASDNVHHSNIAACLVLTLLILGTKRTSKIASTMTEQFSHTDV
jgi:hypothetical protein